MFYPNCFLLLYALGQSNQYNTYKGQMWPREVDKLSEVTQLQ